jgi:hypothetical protein
MEYNFHNGEPALFISDKEIKTIESLRVEYATQLTRFASIIREELTDTFLVHHIREANIYELERLRANIYFGNYPYEDINPFYKNLIEVIKGEVIILRGQLYNSFCYAYNVLYDEGDKGRRVLENLLRLHLVDWMIQNDCSEFNMLDIASVTIRAKPQRPDIFLNLATEIFFHFFKNKIVTLKFERVKGLVSKFYHNYNGGKEAKVLKGLNCTQIKFAEFWNSEIQESGGPAFEINKKGGRLQLYSTEDISDLVEKDFKIILSSYED